MHRIRGEHEKKGVIKKTIISYILANPPMVEEPILRQYLKDKYNIIEIKSIRKHLEYLRKLNCITKHPFSGFSNKWSIDDITQVENILREYFDIIPELQKNDEILVMLIYKQFSSDVIIKSILDVSDDNGTWKLLKNMLKLSPTFFEHCLKTKEELIQTQSLKIWLCTSYAGSGMNKYLNTKSKCMQNLEKKLETAFEEEKDILKKTILNTKKDQISIELLVPILLFFDSFLAFVRSDYLEGKIKEDTLGDLIHIRREFENLMEGLEKLSQDFSPIIDNMLVL